MTQVDEALTRKVAELARIEISEEEIRAFTGQLRAILGYVEELQEVDISGVEPLMSPVESEAPLREDRVEDFPTASDGAPRTLSSTPDVLDGGFRVPQVL